MSCFKVNGFVIIAGSLDKSGFVIKRSQEQTRAKWPTLSSFRSWLLSIQPGSLAPPSGQYGKNNSVINEQEIEICLKESVGFFLQVDSVALGLDLFI